MSGEHAPKKPQARVRASGNGSGWGGPARGSHPAKPRFTFTTPGPGRSRGYSIAGEARRERDQRIAEEMRELYYDFATDPTKPDAIRLSAADHLLDRIEGRPVAPIVTASAPSDDLSNMSDEELVAEMLKTRTKFLATMQNQTADGKEPLSLANRALAESYGITQDELAEARSPSGMVAARDPEPLNER